MRGQRAGDRSTGRRAVLCCASPDRIDLAPAAERLVRLGWIVEICSGLDAQPLSVQRAIDEFPDALFVLVRTPALGRDPADLVEDLLEGSTKISVPFHRDSPESLVDWVVTASPAASGTRGGLEELHRTAVLEASLMASSDDWIGELAAAVDTSRAQREAEGRDENTPLPLMGASPANRPLPTGALPGLPLSGASLAEPGPAWRRWVVPGVAAASLLAGVTVLAMGVGSRVEPVDEPEADVIAAAGHDERGASEVADVDDVASAPGDRVRPPAKPAKAGGQHGDPRPLPAREAVEEEVEPEGDSAPAPAQGVLEAPSSGASAAPSELAQLERLTLLSGKAFAYDGLMLLSRPGGLRTYDQASHYCGALELYELDDWRLPTVGELGSFADERLVRRGRYWTETEADKEEDHFLTRDLIKREIVSRPRDWAGAGVICVRAMSSEPE